MEIALLVVLLLLSAAFSGTESAYFSLDAGDLAALSGRSRNGEKIADMLRDPARLLAALLIGNLSVNIVASVVATSALIRTLGPSGVVVAIPAMTVVVLLAGEITPKLLALRSPVRFALVARPAIAVWLRLTGPLLDLVVRATEVMLVRLPAGRGEQGLSREELARASTLAAREASLTETEGRFLSRLVLLGDLDVREIMTPRPAVVSLAPDMSRNEILTIAQREGHNRYPVMDGCDDRPVGLVHLKDLLGRTGDRPLAVDRRDPIFVPEMKSVSSLLKEMKAGTGHLACVVDEHGDYVGIVTLEDCLEALTGPWSDESDRDDPEVLQVGDSNWVASGLSDLRLINETIGSRLQPSSDYVTLGGFVMARLGRIPEKGQRFQHEGYRYTILEMAAHRVALVRVQQLDDCDEGRSG